MTHTDESRWNGDVVYQVYPPTFFDKNKDGVGDIAGMADPERQEYLAELGIDIIWPGPFYPNGDVDGGYDIIDHTDVDPKLGTLKEIDELITVTHEAGRKIILDFVPNHTSDQHPRFIDSCKNPNGESGDFYIWAPAKKLQPGDPALPHNIVAGDRLKGLPEGYTVPNNWSSIFSLPELERLKEQHGGTIPEHIEVPAVTAWVWHPGRGQFYLAEFTPEQPTLKWENPEVRKMQLDVLRFWLNRGVDGFRVDVVNHIGKDPNLIDEQPAPKGQYDKNHHNPHDQWTQNRMVSYRPTLEAYVREMLSVADEYSADIRFVLEDWTTALNGGIAHDWLSRIDPKRATVFNFARLLKTNRAEWTAAIHRPLLNNYYTAFDTDPTLRGGIPNDVDCNHDVDRTVSRTGRPIARANAVIKLSTPGNPYIFQGEEGGFPNYTDIPQHRRKDSGIGLRDGERAPIMWNPRKNAGFSQASEDKLWLPVDPNYLQLNLEDQATDPLSFLSLYRALIRERHNSEALRHGAYNPLETDHDDVLAFGRPHPTERHQYITVANFSGEWAEASILNARQVHARVAISSEYGLMHGRRDDIRLDTGRLLLGPYEALLLKPVA